MKKKTLEKKLDKLWSEYVKLKAGGKCEYCGSKKYVNSHHIYSRSRRSVRWEEDNGVCLCPTHHVFSNEFSAHQAPIEFTEWITKVRGKKFIDHLRFLSKSPFKVETSWLELKIIYFTQLIEKIKSEKEDQCQNPRSK